MIERGHDIPKERIIIVSNTLAIADVFIVFCLSCVFTILYTPGGVFSSLILYDLPPI